MSDGVAPVPVFNGTDLDYLFLAHVVVVPAFLKPKSPYGCRMSLCATEPWLTGEHMLERGQLDYGLHEALGNLRTLSYF